MVIFYLGNFLSPWCTEVHISKTLQKLGHEVVELQENFTQPDHLANRFGVEAFDLFLFTRTWGETLKKDHLDILRRRSIPSASFHLDLYMGLERDGGLGSDPFWSTDFVFTPDGDPDSAQEFRKLGINHHYLKPGVYEDECYIADVPISREIIFVGSYSYHPEYPYRQKLIDFLKNTYGNRFEHWGSQGMGHVRGEDLNRLYASSKIVVGDSLMLPGHTHYWSDRVYETLGRGGFLIHPYIKGLEEEFIDGNELVFYQHGKLATSLQRKIDHWLMADTEREEIRRMGHEFVKSQCTYTQRMNQMLDVIKPNTRQ